MVFFLILEIWGLAPWFCSNWTCMCWQLCSKCDFAGCRGRQCPGSWSSGVRRSTVPGSRCCHRMGCRDPTSTLVLPPLGAEGEGYRKWFALGLSVQPQSCLCTQCVCLGITDTEHPTGIPMGPWLHKQVQGTSEGMKIPSTDGCFCRTPAACTWTLFYHT